MKTTKSPAAEPATNIGPDRVEIADLTHLAMPAAAVLLRRGFVFDPAHPPEMFHTGYANIYLVRGEPDETAVAMAEAAEAIALARQQVAQERDAAAAARETAASIEKAEKEAQANAEIDAHRRAIAALQRSIRTA